MLDDHFSNEEELYRAVRPGSAFWDEERNRPTSGAFKDKEGLSLDRAGGRSRFDSCAALTTKLSSIKAIAYIQYQECIRLGLCVIYKPVPENEYHSEIHESETIIKISNIKAKKLSETVNFSIIN